MEVLPYILGLVFLAFVLMNLWVAWSMKRQQGRPAPDLSDLSIDNGGADEGGQRRLLLYFHSPRCAACRGMTPVIDGLAARHRNVVKVDVQQRPELARRFGVVATPATVLVQEGRIARVLVGSVSARRLESLLA